MSPDSFELLVGVVDGRVEVWVDGLRRDEVEHVSVNVSPRGVTFRVTDKREFKAPVAGHGSEGE